MIIDSITLQNFGVYSGRQQMITTPPSETKPIILIGGLNGGGKTTLLDAIHLVLYGHRAKLAGRGGRSYGRYLKSMVHHGIESTDCASVEIEFSRKLDGQTLHYQLVRSWKLSHSGEANEKLQVHLNGDLDKSLSEDWHEHMDSILPNQMAHLFFFDGEQIADLADSEKAKTLLKTGVHALLGMDLVDRLQEDLVILERRKKLETKPSTEQSEIASLESTLDKLEGEMETAHQKMGQTATNLGVARKEQNKLKGRYKKEGGDLYEQQELLENEKVLFENDIEEVEATIRELAAGAAPLCLVEHLLHDVKIQAEYEIEAEKNRVVVGLLIERDQKLLKNLKKNKIPNNHIKVVEESLKKDRDDRPLADPETCYLGAGESLVQQIDDLTRHELPKVRTQMKVAKKQLVQLQDDLSKVERKLARVPEQDTIAKLKLLLDKANQRCEKSETVHLEEKHAWEVLLDKKEFIVARRNKLYSGQLEFSLKNSQSQRLLEQMPKVLETLGLFREKVVRKHLVTIERLILESFQQLLRKSQLVQDIKIDPLTYEILLKGNDGKVLPFDKLSAGERQLLATAMLWGLIKASGRPLPLIIDTPLGRLDSVHRELLTRHYFPAASHQVFLLSTDEEIDDDLYKSLKPCVGHGYMLEHIDSEQRTQITQGYHWPEMAR